MAEFICEKCGGELRILPGTAIALCDSCGTCLSADPQYRNRDGQKLLEDTYSNALEKAKTTDNPEVLRDLEALFLALGDYRDSVALTVHCRKRLADVQKERTQSEAERRKELEQLSDLCSDCTSYNKVLSRKLLFLESLLAIGGGITVTFGLWNGEDAISSWIASVLIHCLFVLPVMIPTLISIRLNGKGSRFDGAVTLLCRVLAILEGIFWMLTFIISIFGEEINLFMSIWCLLEAGAALACFMYSRLSKKFKIESGYIEMSL